MHCHLTPQNEHTHRMVAEPQGAERQTTEHNTAFYGMEHRITKFSNNVEVITIKLE